MNFISNNGVSIWKKVIISTEKYEERLKTIGRNWKNQKLSLPSTIEG